ncbi:MAG: hypothetical protein R3C53_15135 [Pirellulaceae bacterium]
MRNVVTITIEGLGAGLVGAYGSNTAITPTIDALASRGILLDQCFLDSQDLEAQLTSLATGQHALHTEIGDQPASIDSRHYDRLEGSYIWQRLRACGRSGRFITDSPVAAAWAERTGCSQVLLIPTPDQREPEEDPAECAVVAAFIATAEELTSAECEFTWLHSAGLRLPWDAPLALRHQFIDPDDPDPPSDVRPPSFEITESTDPDLVVGWGQVAAAQVALIDDAIGTLHDALSTRNDQLKFCVVGLGGVPLGEHGRVGWGHVQLYGEELQCVAVFYPTPESEIGWRRGEICQLPDIGATILDWCGLEFSPEETSEYWGRSLQTWGFTDTPPRWSPAHQLAVVQTQGQIWVRSPAWSAVLPRDEFGSASNVENEPRCKLFVKPDDRWETSEIADRRPAIVELLTASAETFISAAKAGNRDALPRLDPTLCDVMR